MGSTIKALKKSLLVTGVASILLTTGCASTSGVAVDTVSPSAASSQSSSPAASASGSATAAPTAAASEQATAPNDDAYWFADKLVIDYMPVKPGESMRVAGGGYKPGEVIEVQGFKLMAMPSYDAANDMYHQVGEQEPFTKSVTVKADAKGRFDTKLVIPAGAAPQQFDVITKLTSDGTANLVRATVG